MTAWIHSLPWWALLILGWLVCSVAINAWLYFLCHDAPIHEEW